MTLEELGLLLRQERESRGISLAKAAADLKISKKYLIALEAGQTDDLPHPVYAKGFVKNYARLLGLDPEEMGAVLSQHYSVDEDQLREMPRYDGRESGPAIKERRPPLAKPGGGGGSSAGLAYALIGLIVAGGLVWLLFFSGYVRLDVQQAMTFIRSKFEASPAGQPPKKEKTAPADAEHKADKPAPKPEAAAPAQTPAPAAPAAAAQAPAESAAPVQRDFLATGSSQSPAPVPAAKPEPAITPEKLAAESLFAANGKQVVEVNANQPATVEVSTEDGRTRAFTLVKGQRMSLRFNDNVVVRFLQAPSVSIRLNGKEYPLEGGKADGKSITFP